MTSANYLYCRVVDSSKGRALVPDDRASADLLAQVKIGRTVMVKTKSARNPKQHRLLWSLAAKIAENVQRFDDAEHVVHELKLHTGHVERKQINVPGLGVVFQEWPKSISYESMSQEDFANWFPRVIDYVRTVIWPGITSETIRNELREMIGEDDWPELKAA